MVANRMLMIALLACAESTEVVLCPDGDASCDTPDAANALLQAHAQRSRRATKIIAKGDVPMASGKVRLFASKDGTDPEDQINVIIKYENDTARDHASALNVGLIRDYTNLHLETIRIRRGSLKTLEDDSGIIYVEESQNVSASIITPAPEEIFESLSVEEKPYGIIMVEADQLDQGPNLVTVCVIDTGYGEGHPDLPTIETHHVAGTDTDAGIWKVDGHGHGSHCAGTIGAIGDNQLGVTSVNPDPTKIVFHIGKGLSDSGSGNSESVMEAVQGCVDAGAKVISMSLGGGGYSQSSAETYASAYDAGILIFAAAGNGGESASMSWPAGYPHVVSVAAVDSAEQRAVFSQNDEQVELAAPGVGVKSTITTSNGEAFTYATWSGTSMACPHAAGVAALVWSHFQNCSNHQIRSALLKSAQDKGPPGCDYDYGFGIVKAKAAYEFLLANGCGADDPIPLSAGGVGGCEQTPQGPTPAPTPCDGIEFKLKVNTDDYGSETSWKIIGEKNIGEGNITIEERGTAYGSNREYIEEFCLTSEVHYFSISDEYGDGMCCGYGQGSYEVYFNNVLVKEGGQFGAIEWVKFGGEDLTPSPPIVPTSAPPTISPTSAPTTISPTSAPTPSPTMSLEDRVEELEERVQDIEQQPQ